MQGRKRAAHGGGLRRQETYPSMFHWSFFMRTLFTSGAHSTAAGGLEPSASSSLGRNGRRRTCGQETNGHHRVG